MWECKALAPLRADVERERDARAGHLDDPLQRESFRSALWRLND